MKRSPPQDPGLFDDLPLHTEEPPGQAPSTPAGAPKSEPTPPKSAMEETASDEITVERPLLLFEEDSEKEESIPAKAPEKPEASLGESAREIADLRRSRLIAGLLDFGVVLAVAISVVACAAWMGVDLVPLPWAPISLFLLAFSFLYCVFPLAFWGRTPGMAWMGLQAKSLDGRSLSFGQTAWRWLAGVGTVLTFGLPLLLTLKDTFLADVVSRSAVDFARN